MGVVSREKNSSARLQVKSGDEIGRLVEEFDKMLVQIELRDRRLKHGIQELPQAKETAEYTSRSKPDFLSNKSHKLRRALNAIMGLAEVVIDLSKAVKFTPDGGIIVLNAETVDTGRLARHLPVAHREKGAFLLSDSSRTSMKVSVADTGAGIKTENFDKIFRPFQQEGKSISREFGGTGLRLTLSRKIISLQGGWIWGASHEGEGSVFSFVIPLRPEAVVDGVLHGAEDAEDEDMEEQFV